MRGRSGWGGSGEDLCEGRSRQGQIWARRGLDEGRSDWWQTLTRNDLGKG